jgi:hypothetical protein
MSELMATDIKKFEEWQKKQDAQKAMEQAEKDFSTGKISRYARDFVFHLVTK